MKPAKTVTISNVFSQPTDVLYLLRKEGPLSASDISMRLEMPQASVRRAISTLQKEGWRISRPGRGSTGDVYTLL